ncbi:MAG: hypothetical protein NUV57_03320 [archaeon]|nr:hypothetical protein [archaeon]
MGLVESIVKGLEFGMLMFLVILIGDAFIPGKVSPETFSTIGVLIIFSTFFIDAIWLTSPVETKKENTQ